MVIIIFFVGFLVGMFLNGVINKIYNKISKEKGRKFNIFVPAITGLIFLLSFLKFGMNLIFAKSITLGVILIIVSFVDLKYKIIPDSVVLTALMLGLIFSTASDISFGSSIAGMILGGGLLFIFALVPNAMGGGDIKLMFALGSFLGYKKTLYALIIAFVLASIIGIILILFKLKGRKDLIPFGPFLALGTFSSFLLLT